MYKSLEKTLKSIEKYSKKDAKSWKTMFEGYLANRDTIISIINSPTASPLENTKERLGGNRYTDYK
jgi:beta-carotene ketolase (CrtO type)